MIEPVPGLRTNAQVKLGLSLISRAELGPNYRLMPASQRYQRVLDLATATMVDALFTHGVGTDDLGAVVAYFTARRDAAARREAMPA